jgi:hypothetical protein
MLGRFYCWFWYHTEFWLTKGNRRPYTFIMRDWIYRHVNWFTFLVVLFYGSMITLSVWHGTASTITIAVGSFLLAHLVWGTKWIEGEQEFPPYNPDETDRMLNIMINEGAL